MLLSLETYNNFICQKKEKLQYASRTKCQALTIARLTHSPYATKIARIRRYATLSTMVKCTDVQRTISG